VEKKKNKKLKKVGTSADCKVLGSEEIPEMVMKKIDSQVEKRPE
jgi:hypothetical protein